MPCNPLSNQTIMPGLHVMCANGDTNKIAVIVSTVDDLLIIDVPDAARNSQQALRQVSNLCSCVHAVLPRMRVLVFRPSFPGVCGSMDRC